MMPAVLEEIILRAADCLKNILSYIKRICDAGRLNQLSHQIAAFRAVANPTHARYGHCRFAAVDDTL